MRRFDGARLILLKALLSALVLASGFSAVSDDDYARLVIAQRFAHAPSLDPSGTSWLPLPFYLYGAVAGASQGSLLAARLLAIALGMAATLLVWCAARQLGLARTTALGGAMLAALLPYSAYLGVAWVPEAPTAALTVFAAATLNGSLRMRLFGALALFAACASRYEPWATAAVFTICCGWDALRRRQWQLSLPAVLAAAFPLLWLLHGTLHHGQALFFVTRVTAYRAALGPDGDLFERATRTPLALFSGEPELMAVFTLVCVPLLFTGASQRRQSRVRWPRFAIALLAIAVLTWVGDVRGSAPTHHPGRALLALWFGAALAVAAAAERARSARSLVGLVLAALLGVVVRYARPREAFIDRRSAVAIGKLARDAKAAELVIDAPDFSYFAVEAGFAQPTRCRVLCEHDPRRPCEPDWFPGGFAELQTRSAEASWLVLPSARLAAIEPIRSVVAQNADWALIRLHANAGAPEAPQRQ